MNHFDYTSYQAGGTIQANITRLNSNSVALFSSNLHPPHLPLNEWHAAAMARKGRHWFVYSSTFDPRMIQNQQSPRIGAEAGLSLIHHTLRLASLSRNETYAPVRNTMGQAVKGRGLRIDQIWLTGSASPLAQCLREATEFAYRVAGAR